ncbi:MAG: PGPGW domain-containing protein [Planctomycetota bacterium]
MPDWVTDNGTLIAWLTGLSILTLVLSAVLLPVVVARMPADYFVRTEPAPDSFRDRHPALRILVRVAKNLLGIVFLVAGFAMLFVPGQGVLTILVGLMLVEGPGKRRFELWLVRKAPVRKTLDWIRAKAGQPPLLIDEAE